MSEARAGLRHRVVRGLALACAIAAVTHASAEPVARAPVPEALPGAEAFPKALRARLSSELSARGRCHQPRTRHRDASGCPLYSNRLLLEASPYLQQHAHNPVDWHPWGDEAFAKARRLGRPVLVSIGYSTCHWCHVMEDESFEDVETATLLNSSFVAIKVDRELRPDVDSVYMTAIHALGESGGWPLNVFVTPDREPFYAGTYFPPEDAGGRPSFGRVLVSISEQWTSQPARLRAAASQLGEAVRTSLAAAQPAQSRPLDPGLVERAVQELLPHVDEEWGGVGKRTKFPSSMPLRLWMRAHASASASAMPERAAAIEGLIHLTLDKMASGGMRDQLGGGFHRYATESSWLIPHFEKMLYDNALLAILYVEAWQWSGEQRYAEVARDTLAYLDRELSAPGGGFHSATDADSLAPGGKREEGRYFTWTPTEMRAALPAGEARAAIAWWGVSDAGDLDGRSILREWRGQAEVAGLLGVSPGELRGALARARPALYEARSARPPPLLDDKVIAAWNGLAISAFARAGFAMGRDDLRERAARAASFLLAHMRGDGRLHRVFVGGRAEGPAFLADYSFVIAGLLDLFEAGAGPVWLEEAIALQAVLDAHYLDAEGGGYFQTAHDAESLLVRQKPLSDAAIPSGNSVAASNLLRLAELTGKDAYRSRATALFSALAPIVESTPASFGELLLAVDFERGSSKEIVLVAPAEGGAQGVEVMLAPLRAAFVPSRVLASVTEGESLARTARMSALVAGKQARGGRVTAYVCEDRACAFPTTDPAEFARQLGLSGRAENAR